MKKSVIIGAGVGGLASAIRLARMGWQVDVLEASAKPGGKVAQIRGNGFRFDGGPSLFTLPELTLELLDKDLQFEVERLPVITRYFWNDGLCLDAFSDVDRLCSEAEEKTGTDANRLKQYLAETEEIYSLTAPVFIFNSLHKPGSLFKKSNLPALFGLHKLKAFRSLHSYNKKAVKNERMVQLLDRYATYNGSDPYQTPATLRVIAHLEHNLGAWLPAGGMYSIVEALVKQAKRLKVRFHFNEPVTEVKTERRKISGLVTSVGFYPADAVVSNVDIYRFYASLMPNQAKFKKLDKQQRSTSAIIFYWGMKGTFDKLDVHNIFFSDNYPGEFEDLFINKTISGDPTVYVYISSKLFPADAPEQCENWFVMVNAPENAGQDREKMIAEVRKNIVLKLEKALGTTLNDKVAFEEVLDPVSIEEKTGSWNGALYGPSSNSLFSAFRRHPNFSRSVRGLYFSGGSVHPGGGIPLCISSAKIVASLIENDFK